jgi:hypothetical protein
MPGSQRFYGAKPILLRRSLRTAPGLPKSISQGGGIPPFGFLSDGMSAIPGPGVLSFVSQVSLIRVLVG